MSVFIEKVSYVNSDNYIVGLTTMDVSTGKKSNYLHSILNYIEDSCSWRDEIGRYIHYYNPSEIIFHSKNMELTTDTIIQNWDISHNSIQINLYKDNVFHKLSYQNEFLQGIFKLKSMTSPIEAFDLEKPRISCFLYISFEICP